MKAVLKCRRRRLQFQEWAEWRVQTESTSQTNATKLTTLQQNNVAMRPSFRVFSAAAVSSRLHVYRLSAVSNSCQPLCRSTTSSGHELVTDVPRAAGGRDLSAQPVEMMIASLLGCKVATTHFVARHLWPRAHNRVDRIEFVDVEAARDDRGSLHLPINDAAPVSAALL